MRRSAFLRELEHYARLPCYAYRLEEQDVSAGRLIHAILLPDGAADEPAADQKAG